MVATPVGPSRHGDAGFEWTCPRDTQHSTDYEEYASSNDAGKTPLAFWVITVLHHHRRQGSQKRPNPEPAHRLRHLQGADYRKQVER